MRGKVLKVEIRDLDVIENMGIIFENNIIVWGAGKEGHKLVNFLNESVGLRPLYVCDKDDTKCGTLLGSVEVCSIQSIIDRDMKDVIIIISSSQYLDDMFGDITRSGIGPKGVYTYMAVWYAVNLNINDQRIKELYREAYKVRSYYEAKKLRDEMVYYSPIREAKNITAEENPVLVFQPGKVASNTVRWSLLKRGVNVIHLHSFPEHLNLQKRFIQEKMERVKIITLVREPIGRDISDFIQYFEWDYLMAERMYVEKMNADIEGKLIESMRNQSTMGGYGLEFSWFDQELRELTGIDVFKYPFDKENGYSIISDGKYQILLLTVEKMRQNSNIIGTFCGVTEFHMNDENIGKNKRYKYLYANLLERLSIPEDVVRSYYCGNSRMDYFYSEEMKKLFLERYN